MNRLLISVVLLICTTVGYGEADTMKQKLTRAIPGLGAEVEIRKTPFGGIYEVINGTDVLYTNENIDFILQGTLFDIKQNKNLTEESVKDIRKQVLAKIPDTRFINFGDPKAAHEVVVLTDVNCGYCRKLHEQRAKYAKLGIRVRYLLTPVLGESSIEKAISVACSDDPNQALTRAKMGIPIPTISCSAPINENLAIMRSFGIQGTPAIILSDGSLVRGYVPPDNLLQQIMSTEQDSHKESRAE